MDRLWRRSLQIARSKIALTLSVRSRIFRKMHAQIVGTGVPDGPFFIFIFNPALSGINFKNILLQIIKSYGIIIVIKIYKKL